MNAYFSSLPNNHRTGTNTANFDFPTFPHNLKSSGVCKWRFLTLLAHSPKLRHPVTGGDSGFRLQNLQFLSERDHRQIRGWGGEEDLISPLETADPGGIHAG
ncbi:hypothetical protein MAP00_003284 [Monascus purpureus]|nr:hypothetical protein MAP00_003284 [Monascus purpureus]